MHLKLLFSGIIFFLFLNSLAFADNQLQSYKKPVGKAEVEPQKVEDESTKKETAEKKESPAEDDKDFKAIDQSEKIQEKKVDLFNPPEFKEPGVVEKTVAKVNTTLKTKTDGLPEISLKALVLKDNAKSLAVLLVDKKELMVEPNEVFPIAIDDSTWELSIKSITRNGVAIEINYNSIKLLVK